MTKEQKERINRRKIAYVYLMHRMFEGSPALMLKTLKGKDITVADLQDWDLDYKDAVYQTIQEEDMRGVRLPDKDEVPSIKSIKEKVLRRTDILINTSDDPARLAQVYRILSEFETADDKKEKNVLDAINESIKPLTPKKKEKLTMLEKMKQEGYPVGGRKAGRPKKVKPVEAVEPQVGPEIEEVDEETIDETEE